MDSVRRLVGEAHVSRAFRFQGSRPTVSNGVLFETTGDRLVATDLASGQRRWTWDDARSEDGTLIAFETGDPKDDGWPMWGGGPAHNGPDADSASDVRVEPSLTTTYTNENVPSATIDTSAIPQTA